MVRSLWYSITINNPHEADSYWLEALEQQSQHVGLPCAGVFIPDRWLQHGDTLPFGEEELEVLFTSGHTPENVVFFHRGDKVLFVGDMLFQGSIGHTDFPSGNHQQLMDSIKTQLWPLGDAVTVVLEHGSNTTIGTECRHNP